MMDDLILFVAVADFGGFAESSRALHVSPTTISRRIKSLEDKLNTKLFMISPHHFQLTDSGKLIYDLVAIEIKKQNHLIEKIKECICNKNEPTGNINIMLPSVLSMYIINPRVSEFLNTYPKINLHFTFASAKNLGLFSNNADIAILPFIPDQQNQKFKKIFSEKLILVCTAEYAEKYGIPESPELLDAHTVVITSLPGENISNYKEFIFVNKDTNQNLAVQIERRISSDNFLQSIQLVSSHMVILPVIPAIAAELSQKFKLIHVLPDWNFFNLNYYLLKNEFSDFNNTNIVADFIVNVMNDAHLKAEKWLIELGYVT